MHLDVISGLHGIAAGYFKARGFRWEVRRKGDLQLGYWKIKLSKSQLKRPSPKRLVFIPGFGDTSLSWLPVLGFVKSLLTVARDRSVVDYDELVLMDYPGFGGFLGAESAIPSMDLLMEAMADTLDALRPSTIIGHSLGGWLGAQYAGACGKGVRPRSRSYHYQGPERLVLLNPSGVFPDAATKDAGGELFRASVAEGFSVLRPHLFGKEPRWFSLVTKVSSYVEFFRRPDIAEFIRSVRDDHTIEADAPYIQSKVWLIWGEMDSLIPARCAQAWMDRLKTEPQVVLLPGAGHCPHLEQPVVLAAVLGQILKSDGLLQSSNRWWKTAV